MLGVFKYALVLCLIAIISLLVFEAELPKVAYSEGGQLRVEEQEPDAFRACVRAYGNVTSWEDHDWSREPVLLCNSQRG